MTYILIIILLGHSHSSSVEFSSQQLCENAKAKILRAKDWNFPPVMVCVPK
jgi:hypothetical protein